MADVNLMDGQLSRQEYFDFAASVAELYVLFPSIQSHSIKTIGLGRLQSLSITASVRCSQPSLDT